MKKIFIIIIIIYIMFGFSCIKNNNYKLIYMGQINDIYSISNNATLILLDDKKVIIPCILQGDIIGKNLYKFKDMHGIYYYSVKGDKNNE